jgi:oxygen-dependent protoporphyrinogen oxidase
LLLGKTVEGLQVHSDAVDVVLSDRRLKADFVISALPSDALKKLIGEEGDATEKATVDLVSFGFHQPVLPKSGFGYLVPSASNEEILGMVWDSCVFPQQNLKEGDTRLTVMLGGIRRKEWVKRPLSYSVEAALACLTNHLSIRQKPDCICSYRALQAIPQYQIGHQERTAQLEASCKRLSSRLSFIGNSFYGVSVNDCIAEAKKKADEIAGLISYF